MSKDVILDKYARLYEIPNQLALLGHQVECFCLSYQSHQDGDWDESDQKKSLIWHSKSYIGMKKALLWQYPFFLLKQLTIFQPDIIIAASDIPHIIFGAWCAKKLDQPFVADLYDNFESYGQARIPLFRVLFHKALNQAQVISTTSYTLANKIKIEHPHVAKIFAMPSVIDKKIFFAGDKIQARKELKLPVDAKLIGTAGNLTKMKGIEDLFNAWEILRQQQDNVYLILAGPMENDTPLPNDHRVIYLGLLSHKQVNLLFQALDIGVLCITDDEFGRYCFPQKAYEMLATHLTIISSAVGDMQTLIGSESLYIPNNIVMLAQKIILQLDLQQKVNIQIPDWQHTITHFNDLILTIEK
ncbi:glycosyltransferase family 4 protein [Acinetobacter ursingii]|uniref:glycosyltransferase family 4 protein n=1 Tax=Acinetobacter ursingii TaxID=108980 RepID=UPI0032B4FEEF